MNGRYDACGTAGCSAVQRWTRSAGVNMASRVKVVSASLVGQEVSAQLSIQGSRVAGIHAYNT